MTPPITLPTAPRKEMESLTIAEYVVQKEPRKSRYFTLANAAALLNSFIKNGTFAHFIVRIALFKKMSGGETDPKP